MKRSGGILHSHFEKRSTRIAMLKVIAKRDVRIALIKIDKFKVPSHSKPHTLYENMVISLLNRLTADGILEANDNINFIASQMDTNKNAANIFCQELVAV
jgi:hypothetical protein